MGEDANAGVGRAKRMLKVAYDGLKQFENGDGSDRIVGLMNAVSAGRSVTWILQNNLKHEDGFDEWYSNCRGVMEEDEVCSEMIEIRNNIVKEGDEGVSNYTRGQFNGAELARRQPPWADGLFVGDVYAGSGFYIEGPDGEKRNTYQDFPNLNVETGLYFDRLNNLGDGFDDISDAVDDLRYYLRLILEIVNDAEGRFT